MEFQAPLFTVDSADVYLRDVPIDQCRHSRFNTRKTHDPEQIKRLAERILRIGFDRTRALWALQVNGHYEVFAGGTRLEAARLAGLKTVPIMEHVGLTDEEIVQRADADNDSDEYHAEVPIVQEWAEYARLRNEEGWNQAKIGETKGFTQPMVSYRLRLHKLPDCIKEFINQGLLYEAHLIKILDLSIDLYFSCWLSEERAMQELTEIAVNGIRNSGKKSSSATAGDVKGWKEFIAEADRVYHSLKPRTLYAFPDDGQEGEPTPFEFDAPAKFVAELAEREARSKNKVTEAARAIRAYIKDNLEDYEEYIKAETAAAARAAIRDEHEKRLLAKFVRGDCVELMKDWQLGAIKLILIDPPYGKGYQSNRRWKSEAPAKIVGDEDEQGAMSLLEAAMRASVPHLADDAHVLVFCDWRGEPQVRGILTDAGLNIKGSLIWVKEEHSAGDVKGAFGPSHERIIHAVKGTPLVTPRIRDVLEATRTHETDHPTEKPVTLLERLINSTTDEGDLVIDLFAGGGSTLVAALRLKRDFFGVEIDPDHHDQGTTRLLREFDNGK